MKIRGKVAIVTGGGKGIGRETAIALAREGLDIGVLDIIPTGETEPAVRATGRLCTGIRADVSKSNDAVVAVNRVVQEFGTLDILVNNAGILKLGDIAKLKDED